MDYIYFELYIQVGYSIGRTYTSLTGFFRRRRRGEGEAGGGGMAGGGGGGAAGGTGGQGERPSADEHPSAGKVQLVALGRLLQRRGFELWNLGHPPRAARCGQPVRMLYKREIGGVVFFS